MTEADGDWAASYYRGPVRYWGAKTAYKQFKNGAFQNSIVLISPGDKFYAVVNMAHRSNGTYYLITTLYNRDVEDTTKVEPLTRLIFSSRDVAFVEKAWARTFDKK